MTGRLQLRDEQLLSQAKADALAVNFRRKMMPNSPALVESLTRVSTELLISELVRRGISVGLEGLTVLELERALKHKHNDQIHAELLKLDLEFDARRTALTDKLVP